MIGAQEIAKTMKSLGIKKIFLYPGGTIAPLLDALINEGIDYYCFRNEQGAGYAAIGAAKQANFPQVVMVTSGPGATNLVSPIADAYYDSVPLLVFTGQVGTKDINFLKKIRQTGFQETDTVGIYKSITKKAVILGEMDNISQVITNSFNLSLDGRPGPVLIDLPMDVQFSEVNTSFKNKSSNDEKKSPTNALNLPNIVQLLNNAKRPLILAGNGIYLSGAVEEFRIFIEKTGLPVVTSMPGIGILPSSDPSYFGFVGHTGEFYANLAMYYSDLLLVLGSRLDLRQTGTEIDEFKKNKRIIKVDIDKNEIEFGRIIADINVNLDLKSFINKMNILLNSNFINFEWMKKLHNWEKIYDSSQFYQSKSLSAYDVIKSVDGVTMGKKVIVSSGVGTHQQLAARYFTYDYPDRRWMTSAGHGTMGFDLPSNMGALLNADEDVFGIVFAGDGSFQMNIQELATVKELDLPIKIFVLDNQRLGIVSQFQLLNWQCDPSTGNKINPSFSKIAKGYGINGFDIRNKSDIPKIMDMVFEDSAPVLVHCYVDPSEDVLPMLLPGQKLNEMYPFEREEL